MLIVYEVWKSIFQKYFTCNASINYYGGWGAVEQESNDYLQAATM